ncbi:binding-protein-dependent transport systems inner membrane component [Paenibacillus baekrokdamisoli]|uniref:Binding-protein-dependent transport systems inner membrane component n=1 Tax=Paenibacillus baekrokdamisoli TaxID=1712516 RepID=A0A3G9JFT2_9BACL|nr:sugar ABC transporter permease [Paenibacillus baekrokdamisoli]MBB3072948.1 raffinose/stachyose/melibiose transport system permease protein [Paenibacillus baekrokdamisoli]BBH22024.1 binding-protein-dependent transport systems inner membrane component [Paenibacillus baekrokdamisoli]
MKSKVAYLCLLPTFLFVCVFLVYPTFEAIRISFLDWNMRDYYHPTFVGLANYREIFNSEVFINSFKVLLIFLVWALVVLQGISVLAGYLIYLLGASRFAQWIKVAFIIPMVIPGMVITMFWLFFYEPNNGMLNVLLRNLDLDGWQKVWLGESQLTAIGSLLMKGFPWISGIGFLIYLAGFQSLDESVRESARIDGASAWTIFWSIDLPLIIPQLKLTTILVLIGGIQQYGDQYIITKGGPGFDTMVPGLYLFNNAFNYGKLGVGSAAGVTLFLIIALFTILNLRFMKSRT